MKFNTNYMTTYTNWKINPLHVTPNDIDIRDIARGLSMLCRFSGQVTEFYSVAQHSVLVADLCLKKYQLYGLLHDASEAYLGDVIRPIKHLPEFRAYRLLERRFMKAIAAKFDLKMPFPKAVKIADDVAVLAEARQLYQVPPYWTIGKEASTVSVCAWNPASAESAFLHHYNELIG